jgi:hypothetical protein
MLEKFEFFPIKFKIQRAASIYQLSRETLEQDQQIEGKKIKKPKTKVCFSQ